MSLYRELLDTLPLRPLRARRPLGLPPGGGTSAARLGFACGEI
ncbi:MAG: hypothetical protein U0232_20775 [Thermomicrobiales bacterium]